MENIKLIIEENEAKFYSNDSLYCIVRSFEPLSEYISLDSKENTNYLNDKLWDVTLPWFITPETPIIYTVKGRFLLSNAPETI